MLSNDVLSILADTQYSRWNLTTEIGTPIVVTYSFSSSTADYDEETRTGFGTFSDAHKQHTRQAFDVWEAASGLTFVEVPEAVGGTIRLSMVDMSGQLNSVGNQVSGYAYYPWPEFIEYDFETETWETEITSESIAGDIFLNSTFYADSATSIQPGIWGFSILLHEIGHAIGLEHPFEGDVTINPAHDHGGYTVMSYNTSHSTTTLGSLDFEATQYLHGLSGYSAHWSDSSQAVVQYGNNDDNIITGWDKKDKVYAGSGADRVYLGDGDDYVLVGGGVEEFHGGDGTDYISYYYSANGVKLNLENNTAAGSWADNDTISGFESASGSDTGDDIIYGTSGANHIKTNGGDDKVYSGTGADNINLGAGDDYVLVGGGAEKFAGGSGTDYISYYYSANGVKLNLENNTAAGSWADNDTISGFESASGSDTGDDIIYGTSGANHIKTNGGDDKVYSGTGADNINLGAGDDYVLVGGGTEKFAGGSGTDYISYYYSPNGVKLNLENNTAAGSWADNDTISGFESVSGSNTGDDIIYGTSGANHIKANGGDDKIYAGTGADNINLGAGDDYVLVGGGTEKFAGGSGTDWISYFYSANGVTLDLGNNTASRSWADNDTINGFESASGSNTGDDNIFGTSGANRIKTYGGDDQLSGRAGDDELLGGDGEDHLNGGAGNDLLYGGADEDVFRFNLGDDHAIIKDFEDNIDVINLDGFNLATTQDGLDLATQVAADVVIDFGGGDILTIENFTVAQLNNDLDIL